MDGSNTDGPRLTLDEARQIVRRAVAKAQLLGQRGAFVVVDDGGNVVSVSRMDGAGTTSIGVSRAKAYVAATNRETSARFATRLGGGHPGLLSAYQRVMRHEPFPGPGAVPVVRDGVVVGALSTGAGIGPSITAPGIPAARFLVDGKPANAEDLIIADALGIPYVGQHGDDAKRWEEAYGEPPPTSSPADEGPVDGPALPPRLAAAVDSVDRAIAQAVEREATVAVALVDRHGDLVQLDRMDGAPPVAPDIATALAVTALNFRRSSGSVGDVIDEATLATMTAITRTQFLTLKGGLPRCHGDEIIGAVGVFGSDDDEEIARAATIEVADG